MAFAFVAHRAVVDVDVELGLVRVVQIATAQDVGRALNPLAVIGQIEGGIAQGLGLAVMEEIVVDRRADPQPVVHRLPAADHAGHAAGGPDLIEQPERGAPYGAKGVGEPPTISSTGAIVAAIRAATGRPLNRIPVRAGRPRTARSRHLDSRRQLSLAPEPLQNGRLTRGRTPPRGDDDVRNHRRARRGKARRKHPVDTILPVPQLALYGFQHVLAFYAGAVICRSCWPPPST